LRAASWLDDRPAMRGGLNLAHPFEALRLGFVG